MFGKFVFLFCYFLDGVLNWRQLISAWCRIYLCFFFIFRPDKTRVCESPIFVAHARVVVCLFPTLFFYFSKGLDFGEKRTGFGLNDTQEIYLFSSSFCERSEKVALSGQLLLLSVFTFSLFFHFFRCIFLVFTLGVTSIIQVNQLLKKWRDKSGNSKWKLRLVYNWK